jgi:hypothetical protein
MAANRRFPPIGLVLAPLAVVTIAGAALYLAFIRLPDLRDASGRLAAFARSLASTHPSSLAPPYADSDGNGLASPPAITRSPTTLRCAFDGPDDFRGLLSAISRATSRPVENVIYTTTAEKLAALRAGDLHIAMIPAADVPLAVNTAGFHPIARSESASPARQRATSRESRPNTDSGGAAASGSGASSTSFEDNGAFLLASRKSAIPSVSDARPFDLLLISPAQRWPLALLAERGFLPTRDFDVRYSGSAQASRVALTRAPVTDRPLLVALDATQLSELRPPDFRVLLASSDAAPFSAFGTAFDLDPALQTQIRSALLLSGARTSTDYRRDFAFWRALDLSIDPALAAAANSTPASPPPPPPHTPPHRPRPPSRHLHPAYAPLHPRSITPRITLSH